MRCTMPTATTGQRSRTPISLPFARFHSSKFLFLHDIIGPPSSVVFHQQYMATFHPHRACASVLIVRIDVNVDPTSPGSSETCLTVPVRTDHRTPRPAYFELLRGRSSLAALSNHPASIHRAQPICIMIFQRSLSLCLPTRTTRCAWRAPYGPRRRSCRLRVDVPEDSDVVCTYAVVRAQLPAAACKYHGEQQHFSVCVLARVELPVGHWTGCAHAH
ncbi:hypothetical protein C8Q80DRAFT_638538 [Daedaleopsis nitida]|nr:hypothetical protein C8Q80DRAFT_638538 [Daedaleopsis nitida]